MEITKMLKERFCRDCKVPIQLYDEPYFSERIELFDKEDLWNEFVETVNKFSTADEYLAYYNSLKDSIINYIKESPAYKALQEVDMNSIKLVDIKSKGLPDISSNDVYKPMNEDKFFLSIDLAKGNFSSLVYFSKKHLPKDQWFNDGSYDYDLFMSRFTDIEYFKKSKYIREVVFGNCNPKRQVTYERYIMDYIRVNLASMFEKKNLDSHLKSACSDELVYDVDDDVLTYSEVLALLTSNILDLPPLHINLFKLLKFKDLDIYYISHYAGDDENKVKKADPVEMVYISRFLQGEDPINDDAVFYSDKHGLAKLLNPIKISL